MPSSVMEESEPAITIHRSSVETLTVEAMVLIDELESYCADSEGALNALTTETLAALMRARLQVSARLTQMVDWLVRLDPQINDMAKHWALEGQQNPDDLPPRARALIAAAQGLFCQVDQLSDIGLGNTVVESPARALQERVARSFEREV